MRSTLKKFYEEKYKTLLILPFLLLFLALAQIGLQYVNTGDFVNKGVSLKGGSTITLEYDSSINPSELESFLQNKFSKADISIRTISSAGQILGFAIDTDAQEKEEINSLLNAIGEKTDLEEGKYNIEVMGSSLGQSFFRQTAIALLIAFFLMGIVVFI
jgi:preprotein translocase subunit SecF